METQSFEAQVLLEAIEKLSKKIDEQKKDHHCISPDRSEQTKDLFTALAKAQGEMNAAYLSSENPYFKSKYADLNEFIKATRPSLTKYGLAVIQQIIPNNDGQNVLHTLLAHSSGQWIESRMRIIPPKSDIQTLGSYITYLRRYSYASLVGVVASSDDDDGERAVATLRNTFAKGTALNTKYDPRENVAEVITSAQLDELRHELGEYDEITEMVLDGLKIQNLADMPKDKFRVAITRVRHIKNLRESKK